MKRSPTKADKSELSCLFDKSANERIYPLQTLRQDYMVARMKNLKRADYTVNLKD